MPRPTQEPSDPVAETTAPGLGLLLFLPYRHLEQRILEAVVAAGFPITLAQARLFQRLDEDGSRLTRLAEAAQITKQTAGYLVDQLEADRYVRRSPDPLDSRAKLIVIADRGRRARTVARRVQEQIEGEWREYLGEKVSDDLVEALTRLRAITDPYLA